MGQLGPSFINERVLWYWDGWEGGVAGITSPSERVAHVVALFIKLSLCHIVFLFQFRFKMCQNTTPGGDHQVTLKNVKIENLNAICQGIGQWTNMYLRAVSFKKLNFFLNCDRFRNSAFALKST